MPTRKEYPLEFGGSGELAAKNHIRTNSDTLGSSWKVGRSDTAENSAIINARKKLD
jgi:hypothetical protein